MDISTLYNGHFHDLGSRPSKLHLPDEVRFLHLVLLYQLRSAAGRTDAADHIIKVLRQEIRLFQLERVLLSLQLLPRVFGDANFKRLRPTGGETGRQASAPGAPTAFRNGFHFPAASDNPRAFPLLSA